MIKLNAQGNCASDSKGTGLASCIAEYGDLIGIDVYPKGYKIPLVTGNYPSESEYEAMIQNQEVYPLNNLYDFDQVTPDNDVSTSSTGIKKSIRPGKPEYKLSWSDGGCFHTGVYDKKGYNRWDIVLKFETGVLYTTNASETELKALSAGMFDVGTYKFQQGTDPDMTTVSFQLTKVNELNLRQNFVTWDALGYDMSEKNGVLDVNVDFATPPSDSDSLELEVISKCNSSSSIDSLDDVTNYRLGGNQTSPTSITAVSVDADTGRVTLTLDSALQAGDTVAVILKGANGEGAASDVAGNFYKGSTLLASIS